MRPVTFLLAFLLLAALGAAAPDPVAYAAAVALYGQKRPLEAQQAFETLARANPDNGDIQFYLGRLALQRDDQEKAVGYLERAASLAPANSHVHLKLGDAYGISAQKAGLFSQLGWARKCKAEYEKAVELDPGNIDARWSLMEFYRQAPGIAGGGTDKALAQALEIKKLDVARGGIAVATVYAADGKFSLAFAEFDAALKLRPDDYAALYQFGRLAALSGQELDRGLAALQQCLALPLPEGQPGPAPVHWRRGNILEKKGDKPGARAAYTEALRLDPKFSQAADALKKLN
jgi:tetratricopeptide (TPR) repeat protein